LETSVIRHTPLKKFVMIFNWDRYSERIAKDSARRSSWANYQNGQKIRELHLMYKKKCLVMHFGARSLTPHILHGGRLLGTKEERDLEFAVQFWCPWTTRDQEVLKKVQKRAVRMVSRLWKHI
jgi:hypothetical protein